MTSRITVLGAALLAALILTPAWGAQSKPGPVEIAAEDQIRAVRDAIVDALWLKTDEYWHGGDTRPVPDLCRMIIQLDPHFTDAYGVGAWVSMQNGNESQAVAFYRQGIERNPTSYELLHEFGLRYWMLHKRDPVSALPYLKRAAELPSPVPIKRTYAHALTKAGRFREAARQWFQILAQHPDDAIARKELAKLRASGKIERER